MPKSKSTYLSSDMTYYVPSQVTNVMTTTSNDIVSFPRYNTDPLFHIFTPLYSSEIPYKLTLSFEELLIPKIKSGGKIPRPLNSWLLFLKDFTAMIKLHAKSNDKFRIQDISSMASKSWGNQPPQVKQFFEVLGVSAKQAHTFFFPGYKFRPERKFKLRFDKKRNAAPRLDLSSQLPLKGEDAQSSLNENYFLRQSNSFSLANDFPSSSSYDLPSSEDIYHSLLQNSNAMNENEDGITGISMKEFYELTILELNNIHID